MTAEEQRLWQQIQAFRFDEGSSAFPFAVRLARDNDWSYGFTVRVIREYRRLVFLAVAAGHPVTPSDQVDQAWHLHLLYTHSYWESYRNGIEQVTIDDVGRAARQFLLPEKLVFLVVGRWAKLSAGETEGESELERVTGHRVIHLPLRDPLTMEPIN